MMKIAEAARVVAGKLIESGFTTYFVGGCVRDRLLGFEPKDYDIATSATPDQVLEVFPGGDAIGAHFGVILVKQDGFRFEVATFRTDGSYLDNRRPESVTFSSPEEDAQRRDFTVNGLFEQPLTGEVIDFVGGRLDIENRTLRAIGEATARFREDALRLLRAVRFATVLDFEIEPATWAAIKENAHLLESIAIERVQQELSKILLTGQRRRGVELLVESGLVNYFLPELMALIGCEQPPQWHPEGDVYTHTCIMLEMLPDDASLELCLAVLLHDIGKPATYTYDPAEDRIRFNGHDGVGAEMSERILRRLKYSNDVIDNVRAMVANHMNFMNVTKMKTSKLKRFMARPTYEDEMELHRVDCGSSNGVTENYDFLRAKEEEFANAPLIPEPLVRGRDLIALGMTPGPAFKRILQAVQNEQLEGRLLDSEQALAWVKSEFEL